MRVCCVFVRVYACAPGRGHVIDAMPVGVVPCTEQQVYAGGLHLVFALDLEPVAHAGANFCRLAGGHARETARPRHGVGSRL